jgi:hypothetical protein
LFVLATMISLFTVSIFSVVAISFDRFWATYRPIEYLNCNRKVVSIKMIFICWLLGLIIGFLPVCGWNSNDKTNQCGYVRKMNRSYMLSYFIIVIVLPNILMIIFYGCIYRKLSVLNCEKVTKIETVTKHLSISSDNANITAITVLKTQHSRIKKREIEATINLSVLVCAFMICKFPINTLNCLSFFKLYEASKGLTRICILIAHLPSILNPILYAYCNKDFRKSIRKQFGYASDPQSSVISTTEN